MTVKLLSTNTCFVPRNLAAVMRQEDEVHPEQGAMTEQQRQKIWKSVESAYKTGNYPFISFVYAAKVRFYSTVVWVMPLAIQLGD